MYNKWLLGGANWLYKKTYKQIDKSYAAFKNRCEQAKMAAKKRENSEYNTITTRDNVDDKAVKLYDGQKATIDKGKDGLKAVLEDIKNGNIDASKATGLTKRLMQELPEGKRQQFCTEAQAMIENLAENMKTIHFVAGQLARAQMAENICMDQNAFKNSVPAHVFEAMERRNALAIAAQMDEWQRQGKNPAKLIQQLNDDVEKANKFADKQYKKEKFDEAGKKGKENKTLRKINETLGIPEEEIAKPQHREPQTMLQHLIVSNNLEMGITEKLNKLNNNQRVQAARNDDNQSRRAHLHDRVANCARYSAMIRSRVNPQGRLVLDRQGQIRAQQLRGVRPQFNMDAYRMAQQQQGASK